MDDKEKLPALHEDNFREYREHPKFKGIHSEKALSTYPAYGYILVWAQGILWHCTSDEIVDFSDQVEKLISDHHEAVALGSRETPFLDVGEMKTKRKIFVLREVGRYFFLKHIESPDSRDQVFDFDHWAKLFAVFALMNLTDGARNIESERVDVVTASNAIIDAMEAVMYANSLEQSGFVTRRERAQALARRSSSGKRLIGATQREKIVREERAKIEADRKAMLASAGLLGAQSRSQPFKAVKSWALEKAKDMRGADRDIARKLAAQMPVHLADKSKDPMRLIYETLLANRLR
jgi:hypothetical protein